MAPGICAAARRAASGLEKAPKTQEPEPVMWANSAPQSYMRSISPRISGRRSMAGCSRAFPARARAAGRSL